MKVITIIKYLHEPRRHDPRKIEYAVGIDCVVTTIVLQNRRGFDHLSVTMAVAAFTKGLASEREPRLICNRKNVKLGLGYCGLFLPNCSLRG